jgi:hypothetical protein
MAELQAIDRKTRKLLTIHRCHHPKASVEWLYLKLQGGRGLFNIEHSFLCATANLLVHFYGRTFGNYLDLITSHSGLKKIGEKSFVRLGISVTQSACCNAKYRDQMKDEFKN